MSEPRGPDPTPDPVDASPIPDRVVAALAGLQAPYASGGPSPDLEERIVTAAQKTEQARRRRWARGPVAWPVRVGRLEPALSGTVVLIVLLFVVVVGAGLLGGRPGSVAPGGAGSATGAGSASASASPSSVATASALASGTCPVTAATRSVAGQAPQYDMSGLRWSWYGVPWVAGVIQKVDWQADAGPKPNVTLFGVPLDLSITVYGRQVQAPSADVRQVYVAAVGTGDTTLVSLPAADPGCWLLTAVWSGGASSVVVAVAPPPPVIGTPSPVPSVPTVAVGPPSVCPATAPSPSDVPQGWPGRALVDGSFRWLLPPNQTWSFSAAGDKGVLDSQVGWDIGNMRITAVEIVHAAGAGWSGDAAVAGDIPPLFGGGTLGFGVALPGRACWAFTYAGTQATSTVVVDLNQ
jgi:hypothetical protein